MTEKEKHKTRDEKIDGFLDALTWYHSEKREPTGFYSTIGRIDEKLGQLNININNANDSSTKLTKALNRITFGATIIAGVGLFIAALNLAFELFKYFWGTK